MAVTHVHPNLIKYLPSEISVQVNDSSTDVSINITDIGVIEIMSLILQGKDIDKDKEEFIRSISKLSFVNNENLQIMSVYEKVKKLCKLMEAL